MLSCSQRRASHRRVQVGRQTNIHSIDGRISQKRFHTPIFGRSAEIQLFTLIAEVPLNPQKVAREFPLIGTHHSSEAGTGYLRPGFCVCSPHEAKTKQADIHVFISFLQRSL